MRPRRAGRRAAGAVRGNARVGRRLTVGAQDDQLVAARVVLEDEPHVAVLRVRTSAGDGDAFAAQVRADQAAFYDSHGAFAHYIRLEPSEASDEIKEMLCGGK